MRLPRAEVTTQVIVGSHGIRGIASCHGENVPLSYPAEWKFEGVGFPMPGQAQSEFFDLLIQIADGSQSVIEVFQTKFGGNGSSTSLGWARSDLDVAMSSRSINAALFIDSLWASIEWAQNAGLKTPAPRVLNAVLRKHDVPLSIEPPSLVLTKPDAVILDAGASAIAAQEGAPLAPVFVLGEQIGSGGYGVVYKAVRSTAVGDFEYALKVLDPSPFVDDYENALKRFQRETKALQSLQHRAIVQHFEAGVTLDRKPYVAMPLIVGSDLRVAASRMDARAIVEMFVEITGGLAYAHSHGVLHRDLKPTNVLVRDSDAQPIIVDFGSAYLLDLLDSDSLTNRVVGTIGYIPIEVLNNPKLRSPLQDVYACGIMLYECLAGRTPDPTDYLPLVNIDPTYGALDQIVVAAIAGAGKRTSSAAELNAQLTTVWRSA